MKMQKWFFSLCVGLVSLSAFAKPVKTFDQATDLVISSVKRNALLPVKMECASFYEMRSDSRYFYIDIRGKHNEECGGDPNIAPRIMSYQVDKKTGKLCTDSIKWAEKLGAADPYNFECRPIK